MHADQIDTDVRVVRSLLAEQFPQWARLPLMAVPTSGTENAVYRLGDEMAVRLPYRPCKDDQIEELDRWLSRFAPHLPLSIPEVLARGASTNTFPAASSIVRWIEGGEATLEGLENPIATASILAEFVRALVAIDATGGPAPGTHNSWRGVPLASRDDMTRRCIRESEQLVDTEAIMRSWERIPSGTLLRRVERAANALWLAGERHSVG